MTYDPAVLNATMEEKAEAFEWLRALAINGGPDWRKAGIALEELTRLLAESEPLPSVMLEALDITREAVAAQVENEALVTCQRELNEALDDAQKLIREQAEALALLRELNDALVIPGWLQPRVDALLDKHESHALQVLAIHATLIVRKGVAHVTSPNIGALEDGEYPLSVHQKYHTATDVERGIAEWRESHDKSKPQEEKS